MSLVEEVREYVGHYIEKKAGNMAGRMLKKK